MFYGTAFPGYLRLVVCLSVVLFFIISDLLLTECSVVFPYSRVEQYCALGSGTRHYAHAG